MQMVMYLHLVGNGRLLSNIICHDLTFEISGDCEAYLTIYDRIYIGKIRHTPKWLSHIALCLSSALGLVCC